MEGADIPIEVALSVVLAAAVDGVDRYSLLAALNSNLRSRDRTAADHHPDPEPAPALVFAFPSPAEPDPDHDGPTAA